MKLYEIPTEYAAILQEIEDADGELSDDLEARLDAIEGALAERVEAVCRVVRNRAAEAEALREESRRLALRAQAAEALCDRLKSYARSALEATGHTKLDAGLFRVSIQRNSQPSVVECPDPYDLPPAFRRVEVSADRSAILASHKAGEELPPGVVVTTGTHLRIR